MRTSFNDLGSAAIVFESSSSAFADIKICLMNTAHLPPLKKGYPLLGNVPSLMKDPLGFFLTLAKEIPHFSRYALIFSNSFYLSKVSLVRHVLVGKPKNYKKNVFYEPLALLIGKGLLTSEGDFWLKQRRIAQPTFHREKIAGFANAMIEVAKEKLEFLAQVAKENKSFDLHRLMTGIAFRIVDKTLLAQEKSEGEEKIYQAFTPALEFITERQFNPIRPYLWLPFPANLRFKKNRKILIDVIKKVIAKKKEEGAVGNDLVSMLLQAKDEETGEGMSEAQLLDEVMTIFLAGFETTANALTWTFYLLQKNPEVREELMNELNQVTAGKLPQASDFPKLVYTQRLIQESLRIFPPVWIIGREALAEDEIENYRIPKGATLSLGIYSLHHDAEIWNDPEKMDPDRFLPERFTETQKLAFFPFGAGPRMCIGNNFAMMELVLVLATILPKFQFEIDPSRPVEIDAGVTLRPKNGMWVTAKATTQSPI